MNALYGLWLPFIMKYIHDATQQIGMFSPTNPIKAEVEKESVEEDEFSSRHFKSNSQEEEEEEKDSYEESDEY
jgi:hypothetical protein